MKIFSAAQIDTFSFFTCRLSLPIILRTAVRMIFSFLSFRTRGIFIYLEIFSRFCVVRQAYGYRFPTLLWRSILLCVRIWRLHSTQWTDRNICHNLSRKLYETVSRCISDPFLVSFRQFVTNFMFANRYQNT